MRKFVLLLLCILFATGVFSQTTYRDEAYKVCAKYYCLLNNKKESQLKKTEKANIWNNLQDALSASWLDYYRRDFVKAAELDLEFQRKLADAKLFMTAEEEGETFDRTDYGKFMQKVKEACDSMAIDANSTTLFDSACVFALEKIERSMIVVVEPDKYNFNKKALSFYIEEQILPLATRRISAQVFMSSKEVEGLSREEISGVSMKDVEWAIDSFDRIIVKSFVCQINGRKLKFEVNDSTFKPLRFEMSRAGVESDFVLGSAECSLEKFYERRANEFLKPWRERFMKEIYNVDSTEFVYRIETRNMRSKDLEFCKGMFNEELTSLYANADKLYAERLNAVKDSLLREDIERYVEVTKLVDEKIEPTLTKWMKDYICYEYSFDTLARIYISGNVPEDSTCQEKYGYLFNDEAEYNKYLEEEGFMEEVMNRIDIYNNYLDHLYYIENNDLKMKFAGCLKEDGNEETWFIDGSHIKKMRKYYSELIDVYMKYDQKMQKEYEKVASLFKSNIEFFELYIQEDYRKLLKNLKSEEKE